VLSTQKPEVVIWGYGHYAEISIVAVLMGWVHLPRELRGQAPVRTHPALSFALLAIVVASEGLVMGSLLMAPRQPSHLFMFGVVTQLACALGVFLHHRHQLVIHTDNVSQLLEERTAALQLAQKELARQNELLAHDLGEQARDLRLKNEVIDRQRRLELAAQTAGQVAHDIQNLISPLFSKIESLEEARTLNEIRGVTSDFRKQVEQLLDLNTNLLALARRGRVELQPVRLRELIVDVAGRFQGQRLTVDSREDAWVQGSTAQLSRAVSNLILNACESDLDRLVDVTVRSGSVEIPQQRRCHLGFLNPGRYAFVEVKDSGPGIPAALLEKIFEPFFSSKNARSKSGSGLGLTIVSAVVDDHKGVLDLETGSTGTRFVLYFPPIEAPDRPRDLGSPSSNATVLVVDDDSIVLKEYGTMLESAGYTVVLAEDGARAIKILQSQEIDLVLLDFNMPRMSGLETFLGAMHVRPGIRAVVHSNHVSHEQGLQLKALGVTAVLHKPAGRTDILLALRQAYQDRLAALNDQPPK
jgi:signal transduction histidine kinase/CheY-like chemotaxis protein